VGEDVGTADLSVLLPSVKCKVNVAFPPDGFRVVAQVGVAPTAFAEWHASVRAVAFAERGAAPSALLHVAVAFLGGLLMFVFLLLLESLVILRLLGG
jgi:hypothetical protein